MRGPYPLRSNRYSATFTALVACTLRPVTLLSSFAAVYKELATDIPGFVAPKHGNLEAWARQGVFLLNASLTVQMGNANSHAKIGWQDFTDAVIRTISTQSQRGVVFLLWGGFAKKKASIVNKIRQLHA